jgi:hypothetical protein
MAAHTPQGAYYLAEVTSVQEGQITRKDILANTEVYRWLLSSGIADKAITDGSVEKGRIYCCGGPNDGGGVTFFYKPFNVNLNPGDIVEIQAGTKAPSKKSVVVKVNIMTRRLLTYEQRKNNDSCHWDPQNPGLWQRVLYCDWMLSEGWIQEDRWYNTPWYKLPGGD